MKNDDKNRSAFRDRMMDYIKGRYNDNFICIAKKSKFYDETQQNIYVKSKKYPDEYINVGYTNMNGQEIFNDNYMYFVYREQTTNFLHELLRSALNVDFKLYYGEAPYVGLKKLPDNATFHEYISSEASRLSFAAILAPGFDTGDKINIIKNLRAAFASHNMIIEVAVLFFCREADIYETLTDKNLVSYMISHKESTLNMHWVGTADEKLTWK